MKATGDPTDIAPSWTEVRDGVEIGFVGAVTEELPSLVSPDGIADIQVTDIVQAVNEEADNLKAGGADIIVMLVHEGSGTTNCTTMDDRPHEPLRLDHPRCQRQHRRHRLRPHPPGVQLLLPGGGLGRS